MLCPNCGDDIITLLECLIVYKVINMQNVQHPGGFRMQRKLCLFLSPYLDASDIVRELANIPELCIKVFW